MLPRTRPRNPALRLIRYMYICHTTLRVYSLMLYAYGFLHKPFNWRALRKKKSLRVEKVECHGRTPSSCTCQMHNDGYIGYNARTFMREREGKDSCPSSPRSFRDFLPRPKNAPKKSASCSRSSLPVRLRRSWWSTREIRACPVWSRDLRIERSGSVIVNCVIARERVSHTRRTRIEDENRARNRHRGNSIHVENHPSSSGKQHDRLRFPFQGVRPFFYLHDPHTYAVTALRLSNN